jgi:hypothetical protein
MRKKTLATGATIAFVLSAATLVAAPSPQDSEEPDIDQLIEMMRKDVRAEKADIVAKTMELSADEAATFWPVYRKYEAKLKALGDERLVIISDYAESYDSLTDEKAKELLTRSLALESKAHALKERYMEELLTVLPATVVARFYQVDSRINNLIDLELSDQIPLAY